MALRPSPFPSPSVLAFASRVLGVVAMAAVASAAPACSRTPPEPSPAASVATEASPRKLAASASGSAETTTTSRCIAKWPVSAPKMPSAATACPPDPEPNLKMAAADVVFPEARGNSAGLKIQAELARSAHDVERGLMYRRTMADDHGMLFKLEGRSDHMFWMRNTCIPLDMMFIDDDGTIVGIVEGAEPLTESTRSVGCPSLFVLEMNAGWSRKHGVAPGQKITLPEAIRAAGGL